MYFVFIKNLLNSQVYFLIGAIMLLEQGPGPGQAAFIESKEKIDLKEPFEDQNDHDGKVVDSEINHQDQTLRRFKRKITHDTLGCRGTYNKAIFYKLDALCDDCYDMYKIPEIHHLCRYRSLKVKEYG